MDLILVFLVLVFVFIVLAWSILHSTKADREKRGREFEKNLGDVLMRESLLSVLRLMGVKLC